MEAGSRTSVNSALIGAIVAVATIGGLLFGYDSGAVNGTQEGLRSTYVFYAVCAVISYFLVQTLVQETKGKELEEMQG